MKSVKIALAFALVGAPLIMGCSSDPGPNEPRTLVAGPRHSPVYGDGNDQVADLPSATGSHELNSPSTSPVPVPWNPPGAQGNGLTPVPVPDGPQPDLAQDNPSPGDHHLYNDAVGETLKRRPNQF
jgi:hypothetical protein